MADLKLKHASWQHEHNNRGGKIPVRRPKRSADADWTTDASSLPEIPENLVIGRPPPNTRSKIPQASSPRDTNGQNQARTELFYANKHAIPYQHEGEQGQIESKVSPASGAQLPGVQAQLQHESQRNPAPRQQLSGYQGQIQQSANIQRQPLNTGCDGNQGSPVSQSAQLPGIQRQTYLATNHQRQGPVQQPTNQQRQRQIQQPTNHQRQGQEQQPTNHQRQPLHQQSRSIPVPRTQLSSFQGQMHQGSPQQRQSVPNASPVNRSPLTHQGHIYQASTQQSHSLPNASPVNQGPQQHQRHPAAGHSVTYAGSEPEKKVLQRQMIPSASTLLHSQYYSASPPRTSPRSSYHPSEREQHERFDRSLTQRQSPATTATQRQFPAVQGFPATQGPTPSSERQGQGRVSQTAPIFTDQRSSPHQYQQRHPEYGHYRSQERIPTGGLSEGQSGEHNTLMYGSAPSLPRQIHVAQRTQVPQLSQIPLHHHGNGPQQSPQLSQSPSHHGRHGLGIEGSQRPQHPSHHGNGHGLEAMQMRLQYANNQVGMQHSVAPPNVQMPQSRIETDMGLKSRIPISNTLPQYPHPPEGYGRAQEHPRLTVSTANSSSEDGSTTKSEILMRTDEDLVHLKIERDRLIHDLSDMLIDQSRADSLLESSEGLLGGSDGSDSECDESWSTDDNSQSSYEGGTMDMATQCSLNDEDGSCTDVSELDAAESTLFDDFSIEDCNISSPTRVKRRSLHSGDFGTEEGNATSPKHAKRRSRHSGDFSTEESNVTSPKHAKRRSRHSGDFSTEEGNITSPKQAKRRSRHSGDFSKEEGNITTSIQVQTNSCLPESYQSSNIAEENAHVKREGDEPEGNPGKYRRVSSCDSSHRDASIQSTGRPVGETEAPDDMDEKEHEQVFTGMDSPEQPSRVELSFVPSKRETELSEDRGERKTEAVHNGLDSHELAPREPHTDIHVESKNTNNVPLQVKQSIDFTPIPRPEATAEERTDILSYLAQEMNVSYSSDSLDERNNESYQGEQLSNVSRVDPEPQFVTENISQVHAEMKIVDMDLSRIASKSDSTTMPADDSVNNPVKTRVGVHSGNEDNIDLEDTLVGNISEVIPSDEEVVSSRKHSPDKEGKRKDLSIEEVLFPGVQNGLKTNDVASSSSIEQHEMFHPHSQQPLRSPKDLHQDDMVESRDVDNNRANTEINKDCDGTTVDLLPDVSGLSQDTSSEYHTAFESQLAVDQSNGFYSFDVNDEDDIHDLGGELDTTVVPHKNPPPASSDQSDYSSLYGSNDEFINQCLFGEGQQTSPVASADQRLDVVDSHSNDEQQVGLSIGPEQSEFVLSGRSNTFIIDSEEKAEEEHKETKSRIPAPKTTYAKSRSKPDNHQSESVPPPGVHNKSEREGDSTVVTCEKVVDEVSLHRQASDPSEANPVKNAILKDKVSGKKQATSDGTKSRLPQPRSKIAVRKPAAVKARSNGNEFKQSKMAVLEKKSSNKSISHEIPETAEAITVAIELPNGNIKNNALDPLHKKEIKQERSDTKKLPQRPVTEDQVVKEVQPQTEAVRKAGIPVFKSKMRSPRQIITPSPRNTKTGAPQGDMKPGHGGTSDKTNLPAKGSDGEVTDSKDNQEETSSYLDTIESLLRNEKVRQQSNIPVSKPNEESPRSRNNDETEHIGADAINDQRQDNYRDEDEINFNSSGANEVCTKFDEENSRDDEKTPAMGAKISKRVDPELETEVSTEGHSVPTIELIRPAENVKDTCGDTSGSSDREFLELEAELHISESDEDSRVSGAQSENARRWHKEQQESRNISQAVQEPQRKSRIPLPRSKSKIRPYTSDSESCVSENEYEMRYFTRGNSMPSHRNKMHTSTPNDSKYSRSNVPKMSPIHQSRHNASDQESHYILSSGYGTQRPRAHSVGEVKPRGNLWAYSSEFSTTEVENKSQTLRGSRSKNTTPIGTPKGGSLRRSPIKAKPSPSFKSRECAIVPMSEWHKLKEVLSSADHSATSTPCPSSPRGYGSLSRRSSDEFSDFSFTPTVRSPVTSPKREKKKKKPKQSREVTNMSIPIARSPVSSPQRRPKKQNKPRWRIDGRVPNQLKEKYSPRSREDDISRYPTEEEIVRQRKLGGTSGVFYSNEDLSVSSSRSAYRDEISKLELRGASGRSEPLLNIPRDFEVVVVKDNGSVKHPKDHPRQSEGDADLPELGEGLSEHANAELSSAADEDVSEFARPDIRADAKRKSWKKRLSLKKKKHPTEQKADQDSKDGEGEKKKKKGKRRWKWLRWLTLRKK